jgi:hypothetical protein
MGYLGMDMIIVNIRDMYVRYRGYTDHNFRRNHADIWRIYNQSSSRHSLRISPVSAGRTDAVWDRLPGFWDHLDVASEAIWRNVRRIVDIMLCHDAEFSNGEQEPETTHQLRTPLSRRLN